MTVCTSSSCKAPGDAEHFTIPIGADFLHEDTPGIIELPGGVISSDGIRELRTYVQMQGKYDWEPYVRDLGTEVKTDRGTWSKRFGKRIYDAFGTKVPASMLERIGSIVANHSQLVQDKVVVTRDLNRSPAYYANPGSCLWGTEFGTRCMLKSNGGFALMTFPLEGIGDDPRIYTGATTLPSGRHAASGRIFVIPLKLRPGCKPGNFSEQSFVPTFNTLTPDAYVLFNGYGRLSDYQGAKTLAAMTGMSYVKINLEVNGMYINSPAAYAVMRTELIADYTKLRDGEHPWIKFATQVHSALYNFEQAEWLDAVAEAVEAEDKAVLNDDTEIVLTPAEKERIRRDRYNEQRRARREAARAVAAAPRPIELEEARPNFADLLGPVYQGAVVIDDDDFEQARNAAYVGGGRRG